MPWNVTIKKKVAKSVRDLPANVQAALQALIVDLTNNGPVRGNWANYSKLSQPGTHHCHLKHHYVACWRETETHLELEVYYAGSREGAPY